MFTTSIFNYYTNINRQSVIFNSMTEKIVRFIQEDLSTGKQLLKFFEIAPEEEKKLLIDAGLIVKCGMDENRVASVKFLDRIVNNDLYLTIMPTAECNFRCIYCYENQCGCESFPPISMSEDIQTNIVRHVKMTLKERYCLLVEWHGGEPLLRTDIIDRLSQEFISVAMRDGKPYIATITTNGYYLTEDVVRLMLKNHVIKFHVTIDGFDWNHDYYRPDSNQNPTFKRIMDNLLAIKHKIKQRNFHVVLRTNVTKRFLPYLDQWLKYLSNNFSDDKRFQIYIKMVEDKGGSAIKKIENDLLESEEAMFEIMLASKYRNNYEYYYPAICNSICSTAMRNKHIIFPDGRIKKCGHYLFDLYSDVGVLKESGIIEYDREHFSMWIKADKKRGEKCGNCPLWASCFNSFCPFKTSLFHNNIEPSA